MKHRVELSFIAVVAVSFLVLVVMAWQIKATRDLAAQGEEAHVALCALRVDLERRVQASQDFLREHPEGIPGIPTATIKQGIDNQKKTIDALGFLECEVE
jgi:hypothetical protein